MSRISFQEEGEEHNFWQNYTDLMSGFLIVFIITSLVAFGGYKVYVNQYHTVIKRLAYLEDTLAVYKDSLVCYKKYADLYIKMGVTESNINDILVNSELYKKIREFQKAQKEINRRYFKYNEKYQRFECTVDVMFEPESPIIPIQCYNDLEAAGKEIEDIVQKFKESTNVSFKIVIEGRAARSHNNPNPIAAQKNYAAKLSYERARNLLLFWKRKGLMNDIENQNGEIFISGSGLEGKGRYTGFGTDGEDRNKTFIIQIIPYITY